MPNPWREQFLHTGYHWPLFLPSSSSLSLNLRALISRDRAGGEQRVPSLTLQNLGTILKEGEGFKRMGVSEGCLAQRGSGGAGEKLEHKTCFPCLILEDLKLGSLD